MLKFLKSLDFQGWLWLLSPLILVAFLALELSGWGTGPTERELELQDHYDTGWQAGFDRGYEAGCEDGYREGHSDAEFDIDDFSFSDYPDLLDEAKWRLEDEASDYAREHGGWTPEEAMEIVEAFENRDPFWLDGSPPSADDYVEAVHTLYYFYEFFS